MSKKIKLGLIFGGPSGEHEVSLSSAISVYENLDKARYDIERIAITKKGTWLIGEAGKRYMEKFKDRAGCEDGISLEESESLGGEGVADISRLKELDLAMPILHGPFGEDGKVQGFLETLGIKYVFSGVLPQALGMNKKTAKVVAEAAGVPVCQDIVLEKGSYDPGKLEFPLIVKPLELGSSVGIEKAGNKKELKAALDNAWKYGEYALVEEFKPGSEFTVTVMEDRNSLKALAVTQILPLISDFYDYKAKYQNGGSRHVCPAELDEITEHKLKNAALSIFRAAYCRDLARADFVMDEKKRFYFIDLNTIPGMTKTSLAPEAALSAGYKFHELLDILVRNCLNRTI